MTNQEPGAPEPLTSEWRHKEGVLCGATVPGFAGPCGYERGEIIHDVGRTDPDTIVGRVHAFEAGWGSGGCERCREGWPCDAERMRIERDAALSHPESDTRGLDETRLAEWFCGTFDHADHEAFLQWGDVCDQGRADARSAAKYTASPDLSIDREGLTVETLAQADHEAEVAHWGFCPHERYKDAPPGISNHHHERAAAILAAIRGATQPEPTE